MKRCINLWIIILVFSQIVLFTATPVVRAASVESVKVWSELPGLLYFASVLAVDSNNTLYAGGDFSTTNDGKTQLNHIAKWDGSKWTPLGTGTNGTVLALAFDPSDNLYIGGNFGIVGGTHIYRVAKWDGAAWSALGTGISGPVYTLVMDANGVLYAGGHFYTAGGNPAANIAKWDGVSWSALGTGMNGIVNTLAIDGSGNLYAGGNFTKAGGVTVGHVAKWDGTTWSALGAGAGIDNPVSELAVDENDDLYAAGYFTHADGVTVNHIAKWDGASWSALGTGLNNFATSILFDTNGNLIAGGYFTKAGGVSIQSVAKWDGANWSEVGAGLQEVGSLAIDQNDQLYAVGTAAHSVFRLADVPLAVLDSKPTDGDHPNVGPKTLSVTFNGDVLHDGSAHAANNPLSYRLVGAKKDGFQTTSCASGVNARDASYKVNSVSYFPMSFKASLSINNGTALPAGRYRLYVCKSIRDQSGTSMVADHIITFLVGGEWSPLGTGTNGTITTIVVDQKNNVYIGGQFTMAGGKTANAIAKWNGVEWSALGAGVNNMVGGMVTDSAGNLYVGGAFTQAGGVTVNYVAKWNGVSWSGLGTGMNGPVNALVMDKDGNLYAGGSFTKAGGITVNHVAKWDGTSWSALAQGLNEDPYNYVSSLAIDDFGDLYAGGSLKIEFHFHKAIAWWDGSSWHNSGLTGVANSLASAPGGTIYGTGSAFQNPDSNGPPNYWLTLGSTTWWMGVPGSYDGEINNTPNTILADGHGNIYTGGWFTVIGHKSAKRIAKWDGTNWFALGSGINDGYVGALALNNSGDLFVGGEFTSAGGKQASNIAVWSPDYPTSYAPFLLTPPNQSVLSTSHPVFDWQDAFGTNSYVIQVARDMDFSKLVVSQYATGSTFTPAADLPPGVSLYWRVRRNSTTGPWPWSATWSFTTANPPSVPVLISPADNVLTRDYTPTLVWGRSTVPAGITFQKYELQISQDSAFTSPTSVNVTNNVGNPRYTLPDDLNFNSSYYWRVRAYNTLGQMSDWSQVRVFRTAIPTPDLTTPLNNSTDTNPTPTFIWEASAGAVGYTIQISSDNAFTALVINKSVAGTSFTPASSLPTGIYFWRVRANGTNGPSSWSDVWSLTIQ